MYISKFAFNAEILPVNVKIFMNKFEGKSKNVRRCLAMCRQIMTYLPIRKPQENIGMDFLLYTITLESDFLKKC